MPRLFCSATIAGLVAMPFLATGCVPQDQYDNLLTANRSLQEQLTQAEAERDQSKASLRTVQGQLAQANQANRDLTGRYEDLSTNLEGLDSEQSDAMRRLAILEMGPLPIELRTAIEDLAMAHPQLLTFDAGAGMVRFSSDLTFDLGSTAIKTEAATTLAKLAEVLDDPTAAGLEIQVVGHTDSVPIGRPETRRAHPTNTHLSVHRAIAVGDMLAKSGIDAARIQVAGYGEHRPIVANDPRRGAAENRRVEIFLVPMPNMTLEERTPTSPTPDRPGTDPMVPMK